MLRDNSFLIVIASNILRCLRMGSERKGLVSVVTNIGDSGTNIVTRRVLSEILLSANKCTVSSVAMITVKV